MASFELRDRCAISGIGSTDFSNNSGRSTLSLATQAAAVAIEDAGLKPLEIDGVVQCDMDVVRHNDMMDSLGLHNMTYWGMVASGGGAPCAMVGQAAAAIMAGLATNVLVWRSLNAKSQGFRRGRGEGMPSRMGGMNSYEEYFVPYGLMTPGQGWAIAFRRHMIDFGTTEEDLGAIAITCRDNATRNPNAQMRHRPLTMEDYLSARMISAPLRLNDYCLVTDGAVAVVVTSSERAKDGPNAPALIRAVAQGSPPNPQGGVMSPFLMRESLTTHASAFIAKTLYERAGCGPEDIKVAQFYDCFTPTILVQLEDYGFCKKGEGGPFASSGAIRADGRLPINTSGGNLSEGYIHGLSQVVEGVRQIRGDSTTQISDADVCLVTSGLPTISSALILRAA